MSTKTKINISFNKTEYFTQGNFYDKIHYYDELDLCALNRFLHEKELLSNYEYYTGYTASSFSPRMLSNWIVNFLLKGDVRHSQITHAIVGLLRNNDEDMQFKLGDTTLNGTRNYSLELNREMNFEEQKKFAEAIVDFMNIETKKNLNIKNNYNNLHLSSTKYTNNPTDINNSGYAHPEEANYDLSFHEENSRTDSGHKFSMHWNFNDGARSVGDIEFIG